MDTENALEPTAVVPTLFDKSEKGTSLRGSALLSWGDAHTPVHDLSLAGVVVPDSEPWSSLAPDEPTPATLRLADRRLPVTLRREGVGSEPQTLAFRFVTLAPSSTAELRFFLSPRRVGESMQRRWQVGDVRCASGWSGTALLWDDASETAFAAMEGKDDRYQALLWLPDPRGTVRVGIVARERLHQRLCELTAGAVQGVALGDRLGLRSQELPLVAVSEREVFPRLSFCRDVMTNFRPASTAEGFVKMRLLRALSEAAGTAAANRGAALPRAIPFSR